MEASARICPHEDKLVNSSIAVNKKVSLRFI